MVQPFYGMQPIDWKQVESLYKAQYAAQSAQRNLETNPQVSFQGGGVDTFVTTTQYQAPAKEESSVTPWLIGAGAIAAGIYAFKKGKFGAIKNMFKKETAGINWNAVNKQSVQGVTGESGVAVTKTVANAQLKGRQELVKKLVNATNKKSQQKLYVEMSKNGTFKGTFEEFVTFRQKIADKVTIANTKVAGYRTAAAQDAKKSYLNAKTALDTQLARLEKLKNAKNVDTKKVKQLENKIETLTTEAREKFAIYKCAANRETLCKLAENGNEATKNALSKFRAAETEYLKNPDSKESTAKWMAAIQKLHNNIITNKKLMAPYNNQQVKLID